MITPLLVGLIVLGAAWGVGALAIESLMPGRDGRMLKLALGAPLGLGLLGLTLAAWPPPTATAYELRLREGAILLGLAWIAWRRNRHAPGSWLAERRSRGQAAAALAGANRTLAVLAAGAIAGGLASLVIWTISLPLGDPMVWPQGLTPATVWTRTVTERALQEGPAPGAIAVGPAILSRIWLHVGGDPASLSHLAHLALAACVLAGLGLMYAATRELAGVTQAGVAVLAMLVIGDPWLDAARLSMVSIETLVVLAVTSAALWTARGQARARALAYPRAAPRIVSEPGPAVLLGLLMAISAFAGPMGAALATAMPLATLSFGLGTGRRRFALSRAVACGPGAVIGAIFLLAFARDGQASLALGWMPAPAPGVPAPTTLIALAAMAVLVACRWRRPGPGDGFPLGESGAALLLALLLAGAAISASSNQPAPAPAALLAAVLSQLHVAAPAGALILLTWIRPLDTDLPAAPLAPSGPTADRGPSSSSRANI